jgi:two-component system sensor histidine kinase KdpD
MSAQRQRAEDFLELVERARRGRLKVYLGFAAGVGKTYRMLEEAHALRKRGVDVVVGFVEPHGREETAVLLSGIEIVPRKQIEYRGVAVEEMDLDAVIARPRWRSWTRSPSHERPRLEDRKRHEDIPRPARRGDQRDRRFNVQHLESLKDLVRRATGVTVHETSPTRS